MQWLEVILTGTAPPPTRLSPDQAGRAALLILMVFLVGFFGVVVLTVMALGRRRARERKAAREQAERDAAKAGQRVDAWEEAGRRAKTPEASDLDDTKVGMATVQPERAPAPGPRAGRPMALVTGASRRVGRAIALELARAGCDVQFTYHRSEQDATSLARELSEAGAETAFFRLDLSDLESVEAFARERADVLASLDVLVHNASVYGPTELEEVTAEEVTRAYTVNAVSPLILTARLAPVLRRSEMRGGGSVVALADTLALGRARKGYAAYAMSKAALSQMVRSLARDLAPQVRVNGVAPGVVAWPESGDEADPLVQAKWLRRIPLGRAGEPSDAAGAVRWLALEAPYVTGEIIRVDGGWWLT